MHQIFLTGASGYIGNLIYQNLSNLYAIKVINRKDKEINEKTLEVNLSPVIIYAAGNKDIKKCESNFELALDANFHYLKSIAEKFIDPYIIYLSTDYVFNGLEGNYSSFFTIDLNNYVGNFFLNYIFIYSWPIRLYFHFKIVNTF